MGRGNQRPLDDRYDGGLQVDNSFALLRLILSGDSRKQRHPDLQLVMPHVGGILPYMSGRIDHQTEVLGESQREHNTTAERVSTTHLSGHRIAIGASITVCLCVIPARIACYSEQIIRGWICRDLLV